MPEIFVKQRDGLIGPPNVTVKNAKRLAREWAAEMLEVGIDLPYSFILVRDGKEDECIYEHFADFTKPNGFFDGASVKVEDYDLDNDLVGIEWNGGYAKERLSVVMSGSAIEARTDVSEDDWCDEAIFALHRCMRDAEELQELYRDQQYEIENARDSNAA